MQDTFEKALENMKSGVLDLTKNGNCTGCGECCGSILPLTDKEIRTIHRIVEKKKIQPITLDGVPLKDSVINLRCPFLDFRKEKDKCTIYKDRPAICRDFRCDKTHKGEKPSIEMLRKKFTPIDMWDEFFGIDTLGILQREVSE